MCAGHVIGVIGPSGAGKSTLLAVLGGCLQGKELQLDGECTHRLSIQDGSVGYLEQDEALSALLSVRETLLIAANFQQHKGTAADYDVEAMIDRLLKELNLWDVRHSRVGREDNRGISGGERRRLALACELVGNPNLLLLDEPTSGLDSAQAERISTLLSDIAARRNIPVIATIHQPRSSMYHRVNSLLLLAPRGRVVFHGAPAKALCFVKSQGYTCPPRINPAEFLIDLVSVKLRWC